MELKQLITLLKKNLETLVIITLLSGLAASLALEIKADTYLLEIYLDIGSEGAQDTTDYKYDNFYRFENSRRLVYSCIQWLKDESLTNEIIQEANAKKEDLVGIDANQTSDTTLQVKWKDSDEDNLKKIAPEIEKILQKKLNSVNDDTDIIYTIQSDNYVIKDGDLPMWLVILAGSFVGLWGSFLWVIVRGYTNEQHSSKK